MKKAAKATVRGLLINLTISLYYIPSAILTRSLWLLTLGGYYVMLSILRFTVLVSRKRDCLLARFAGTMLMLFTLPLMGTTLLSLRKDTGTTYGHLVMITIACYAVTKLVLAIIHLFRTEASRTARANLLRTISFADAFVSLFSLQRALLASFGSFSGVFTRIAIAINGSAVCLIVFLLGLHLKKRVIFFIKYGSQN